MSADTIQLLELLREAGDEAVTLDELAIVGVRDPAAALRALERDGHAVQRVHERPGRGRALTCVRLAPAGEDAAPAHADDAAPAPSHADAGAPVPLPPPRAGRPLLAAAALGVVLLVLVRMLSGRRG
jgi:pyruvate/2-oxoglutarate dehydrogenase complex dihydrolipoamide acyltransferase (E2) component